VGSFGASGFIFKDMVRTCAPLCKTAGGMHKKLMIQTSSTSSSQNDAGVLLQVDVFSVDDPEVCMLSAAENSLWQVNFSISGQRR
jgi:hypothetical protein